MSLPDDLRLREATDADLPALSAMRAAAGWNVHEWALRMAIASPTIRFITVVDAADRIVAMGSGAAYGPLGFVGNMLVAEEHRRQGIGAHVLETILAYLGEAGAVRLELYATSAGRPLYERYGFGLMEPGSRALVPRRLLASDRASAVAVARGDGWMEVADYDAPRFGGDRSSLLAQMANDPERPLLVARRGESIVGYAWLRPGDERLGPFLADAPEMANDLFVAGYERMPGSSVLSMNLPTSNRTGMAWLQALGVEIDPWDGRMGRGPEIPRRIETIYSNTVGALG